MTVNWKEVRAGVGLAVFVVAASTVVLWVVATILTQSHDESTVTVPLCPGPFDYHEQRADKTADEVANAYREAGWTNIAQRVSGHRIIVSAECVVY